MKKKGNIAFSVLVALLVICGGAAMINVASSSRYNARTEYERIENRYIAESGVDLAVGLFINYLDNRELTVSYETDEDGRCSVIDRYSPFILDEIEDSTDDEVLIDLVSNEAKDYLSSIGYLDFKKSDSIRLYVNTYGLPENFRVSNLCSEPDFLVSFEQEENEEKRSKLNPIYLTVKTDYPGGKILCTVKLTDIYAVRESFENDNPGEMGNVSIYLDVDDIKTEYLSYQNYGGNDK